jgi:LAS superfamily LD-carboxypeptidase LdcB|tara:strand:+ start:704 stop:979 length:276 start_codon:yes stop_codon:yes gene_type:complete
MTYQQRLKTYTDRNNLSVIYEEKQISEQTFTSRVIINDTEYKWSIEQPNKKSAKQEAAKIALNSIEDASTDESIKDILIDIRELLKQSNKF